MTNKLKIGGYTVIIIALLLMAGFAAYVFAVSPGNIRNPKVEHAHVRLSLSVDGQEVNFGDNKYQEVYAKGQCSAELPAAPIHFHDGKNHFVHLHWKSVTGGQILKYYGWNMIGGHENFLGYRLDTLPQLTKVEVRGAILPDYPSDAKLWVYTGNENTYKERQVDEFLTQDVEKFLGKESLINPEMSLMDTLFPKVMAHDGEKHSHSTDANSNEELMRVQNLLGNIVIFAQQSRPSDESIKQRFTNLEPLDNSTCGG